MQLTFVGAGYVGLTTSAVLADLGNRVWLVEIDKEKVKKINRGESPIFEPGLEEVVARNVRAGRLAATTDYSKAVPRSKVVFICVGTPSDEDGAADLSHVLSAASSIGQNLAQGYTVIVNKSTVPPTTFQQVSDKVQKALRSRKPKEEIKFDVVSCPEFLREGRALRDTLNPDRIVIGSESSRAIEILKKVHEPINGAILVTSAVSAELIKYASNSFLAAKISFANAMSILCDGYGADINEVMQGIGLDKRITPAFFAAGLGFGGSCFPKDVRALNKIGERAGYDFKLMQAVVEINESQIDRFVSKVKQVLGGAVKDQVIGVLGLSFKPNTDDMREARSIPVLERLFMEGARLRAYDPVAMDNAQKILPHLQIDYVQDPYELAERADCLVLVTEWNEFAKLDFARIKKLMNQPIVADGRNLYDPEELKSLGFQYVGMGQGQKTQKVKGQSADESTIENETFSGHSCL